MPETKESDAVHTHGWEIGYAYVGVLEDEEESEALQQFLRNNWEPYAVLDSNSGVRYFFRRRKACFACETYLK